MIRTLILLLSLGISGHAAALSYDGAPVPNADPTDAAFTRCVNSRLAQGSTYIEAVAICRASSSGGQPSLPRTEAELP